MTPYKLFLPESYVRDLCYLCNKYKCMNAPLPQNYLGGPLLMYFASEEYMRNFIGLVEEILITIERGREKNPSA